MNSASETKVTKFNTAKWALPVLALPVLLIGGCAGPPGGIPLLGPPFDQLASLLVVGGVLGGLYWIVKPSRGSGWRLGDRWRGSSAAEDVVRERYARGEINRSQFTQMLDDLRKGPSLS